MVRYSDGDLQLLFNGVKQRRSLEHIALILGRSEIGVGQKIKDLSEEYPKQWGEYWARYKSAYSEVHGQHYQEGILQYHRQRVLDYLSDYPGVVINNLPKGIRYSLARGFHGNISDAREILKIPFKRQPRRISGKNI